MSGSLKIGFIGQGFIGKNYADDFENRGFEIVRYSRRLDSDENRKKLAECDIVFIAVPTPTTPDGFSSDTISGVLSLVGSGKSAVIKSTILPGTCEKLQAKYPDKYIFHSPEFLTEVKAAFDAANPTRNIVGYPIDNEEYRRRAEEILSVLPDSPLNFICKAKEAELVKYASNCFLFMKVIYANIFYDLAQKEGSDWQKIRSGMSSDPRIGSSHLDPVHASGTDINTGRGAGGHCFIKDFAALRLYAEEMGLDKASLDFLKAAEAKNIELLKGSEKDLDLLRGVYGEI